MTGDDMGRFVVCLVWKARIRLGVWGSSGIKPQTLDPCGGLSKLWSLYGSPKLGSVLGSVLY